MDVVSLGFLVVFVVLGGVIAIIADELGRRIGKRRLVLHRRIRPRTTARIVTFLSGMAITVLTIALVWLVSSDVRVWIREGRRAAAQRDQLRQEVADLQKEQKSLSSDNAVLRVDNKNLASLTSQLKGQKSALEGELASLRSKTQGLQAHLASEQKRVSSLNLRMASLNATYRKEIALRDAAESQRKLAEARVKDLNRQYAHLTKEYGDMEKRNLDVEHQLHDTGIKLATAQAEVDAKTKKISETDGQIEKLNSQRIQLENQISDDRQQLAVTEQQLNDAMHRAEQVANIVRDRPLMFSSGEEIARFQLPAGSSKTRALSLIETAIAAARREAKSRGAARTAGVEYADLIPDDRHISVDAQKDLLASDLAGSPTDQVLIVYSAFNAFKDEGVAIGFGHSPNPVVYQPNQLLAEVRVNARDDSDKLLGALDGLGARVRTRALHDKMIPIQRADQSFGSVGPVQILRLVKEIERAGGSVKVQARARYLTRAADPLVLDFEVQ